MSPSNWARNCRNGQATNFSYYIDTSLVVLCNWMWWQLKCDRVLILNCICLDSQICGSYESNKSLSTIEQCFWTERSSLAPNQLFIDYSYMGHGRVGYFYCLDHRRTRFISHACLRLCFQLTCVHNVNVFTPSNNSQRLANSVPRLPDPFLVKIL